MNQVKGSCNMFNELCHRKAGWRRYCLLAMCIVSAPFFIGLHSILTRPLVWKSQVYTRFQENILQIPGQGRDVQVAPKKNPTIVHTTSPTILPTTGREGGSIGGVKKDPVAIIIPYRDRAIHLKIFVNYMTTFLRRQGSQARIYVVEQEKGPFNRAKLFNVGYMEAIKDYPFTCFIFHDVDLIPESLENMYHCEEHPVHMSAAVDKFQYKIPYNDIFGGVISLLDRVMNATNGFSNVYWGWGGEDDDMYKRILAVGEKRIRRSLLVSRYTMLMKTGKHTSAKPLDERMSLLQTATNRMKKDGLSSLRYKLLEKKDQSLYRLLLVDITSPGKPSTKATTATTIQQKRTTVHHSTNDIVTQSLTSRNPRSRSTTALH